MNDRLVNLALMMGLTFGQTVALPLAVANAADKLQMSTSDFIDHMERIGELRSYVKQACIKGEQEFLRMRMEELQAADTPQARAAAGELPL